MLGRIPLEIVLTPADPALVQVAILAGLPVPDRVEPIIPMGHTTPAITAGITAAPGQP